MNTNKQVGSAFSFSPKNHQVRQAHKQWRFEQLLFETGKKKPQRRFLHNSFEERKINGCFISHWKNCNSSSNAMLPKITTASHSSRSRIHTESATDVISASLKPMSREIRVTAPVPKDVTQVYHNRPQYPEQNDEVNEAIYQQMYIVLTGSSSRSTKIEKKNLNVFRGRRKSISIRDILNN